MFEWLKKVRPASAAPENAKIAGGSLRESAPQTSAKKESAEYKSLGDACLKAGAVDDAVRHYRKALAIDPKFAQAHNVLGDAFREQGKLVEAARSYRAALEIAPDLAEAHYGLGVTLLERADAQNAAVYFQNALRLKPDFARAHNAHGCALLVSGRQTEALACFQKAISLDPDDGMAAHLMASLTGSNPERAPDQYIEKLFDGFANTFDAHLRSLKYETPKHLLALIAQVSAPAPGKWNVLDLGCGTGLAGLEIAPYASQLIGVDLSAKMLQKARARNHYHRLEHSDLLTMMKNEAASIYDLVIATDTFIYLGKLDEIAREACRLLRAGGLFAFSVEALESLPDYESAQGDSPGYRLQPSPSCRYAHSSPYLSKLAADHDLMIHHLKMEHLRVSYGDPVNGYLVVMERQ